MVGCRVLLHRPARYVLFDLDGVLLDSESLFTEATQRIVGEFGHQFGWDLKLRMMGRDSREGARLLVETLGLPFDGAEFLRRRRPHLEQLFPEVEEIPGAGAFVRQLHELGVPMAVATSCERSLTEIKLPRHPWFSHFEHLVTGDDPELTRLKPHPDIFLLAAARLGAPPEDCVVLEDSPAGVEAALAAEMQVIALPDAHVSRADFERATAIVAGYHELSPAALGIS